MQAKIPAQAQPEAYVSQKTLVGGSLPAVKMIVSSWPHSDVIWTKKAIILTKCNISRLEEHKQACCYPLSADIHRLGFGPAEEMSIIT